MAEASDEPSTVGAVDFYEEPEPISAAAVVMATSASPGSAATLAEESWHGESLLAGVVRRLVDLDTVVVVVRAESDAALVAAVPEVTVIVDPEWEEGAAAPLRVGLDWLTHSTDVRAAFVVNLDTPEIEPAALQELTEAHAAAEAPVTVPKYRYVRGGPVLLDRAIWPRFLGAEGDLDLEEILLAHPQWVNVVRVDWAPPRHITSEDDLRELAG
ncbi:NTP transferase domain-containing protein [Actinomycetota bacterium]